MNNFKSFYLTTALICLGLLSYAQSGFHTIGVGAEVALPTGDFGKAYNIGIGATGKAYYGITEKGDITGTIGYIRFGLDEDTGYMSGSMSMIPIMFGYRHDFEGLYVEPQLGLMMLTSKVTFTNDMGIGLGAMSGSSSETKFGLGLGGGYQFGNWDLGARYQIVDNLNFLGVRVGYNFSL